MKSSSFGITGLIFDFDDVIAYNTLDSSIPVEVIFKALAEIGIPASEIEPFVRPDVFRVGGDWVEAIKNRVFRHLKIDDPEMEEVAIEKISEAYSQFQRKYDTLKIYSEMHDLLPALAGHYQLFILSSNSTNNIIGTLGVLKKCFKIIKTYQCVDYLKPNCEGIDFICSEARLPCESVVMIGDSFVDLFAAIGDAKGIRKEKPYFAIANWAKSRESRYLNQMIFHRILGENNRVIACFDKIQELRDFFL